MSSSPTYLWPGFEAGARPSDYVLELYARVLNHWMLSGSAPVILAGPTDLAHAAHDKIVLLGLSGPSIWLVLIHLSTVYCKYLRSDTTIDTVMRLRLMPCAQSANLAIAINLWQRRQTPASVKPRSSKTYRLSSRVLTPSTPPFSVRSNM